MQSTLQLSQNDIEKAVLKYVKEKHPDKELGQIMWSADVTVGFPKPTLDKISLSIVTEE